MMQNIVSIVRCLDYEPARIDAAVKEAMQLAGLGDCVYPQSKVLLKPNLLSTRKPEAAVTTHPAVVRAIARAAITAAGVVTLGDSPPFAGENPNKYAKLCAETGMTAVAEELGIRIHRFEEDAVELTCPEGRFYRNFTIASAVTQADVFINIPKLKTHGLTAFSGAVKNIFGCIPGIRKGLFHAQAAEDREAFAQMLVDLLRLLQPRVNVMDAIIGMEGEGPNAGKPRQIGLIMASADPVALDAVACTIVGIDPMSVHTTRLAHEQGLGCADLSKITVVGEAIESVKLQDFKQSSGSNDWAKIPSPIRKALRRQLVAAPRIDPVECIGCGDCIRACPVNAMTAGHPPKIDLDKCIRCYCCHEVCNVSAVSLRRGYLGELIMRGKK